MSTRINILLIVFWVLISSKSYACSCLNRATIEQNIDQSDVVFVGKVLKIELVEIKYTGKDYTFPMRKVTIKVKEKFKGKSTSKKIIVYTASHSGGCGFFFRPKKSYIVYGLIKKRVFHDNLDLTLNENEIYTDFCTITKAYSKKEVVTIRNVMKS